MTDLYYKYKNEYINLKKNLTQRGGAPFFNNNTTFYVLANITNQNLVQAIEQRWNILLGQNKKPFNNLPHITILQLEINKANPNSNIFWNPTFHNVIRATYTNTLASANGLNLTSPMGGYSILGTTPKYFVREYIADDTNKISTFRIQVYKYIEQQLGQPTKSQRLHNNVNYIIYSYGGNELYAVPEYYHGKGVWVAHLSLANEFDIKNNNAQLFQEFGSKNIDDDKRDVLVNKIQKYNVTPMSRINMHNEMTNITISLRTGKQTETF